MLIFILSYKSAKFILIKMLTNTQQTKSLENGKTLENSKVWSFQF